MREVDAAAGLVVRNTSPMPGVDDTRERLVADRVPGLLAKKDPTLWGKDAEQEASIRLGWVDTVRRSRELVPMLARLRAELSDLDHVVLAGMGGSSLAPEVIARTLGVRLTVLDTTDPGQIRAALADRLDRTVVVVSSKSGSTVETDAQRRAYWQAFEDAGLSDIGRRFVVVTDPGSPLEATGREMGAHVVLADPNVGGRYSALTAFGMVPSALAGVNIAELLDQAEDLARSLGDDEENPALALGAALGAAAQAGRDKVALIDDGSGISGLGDWAEQLIAESTGKKGKGILPVVVETPTAPGSAADDVLTVSMGGSLSPGQVPGSGANPHVTVNGPLGAQFLVWEAAVAMAGRVLGINPFDQPNVTESKTNTQNILDGKYSAPAQQGGIPDRIQAYGGATPEQTPLFGEGSIEVYADDAGGATTVDGALAWLIEQIPDNGYLAVQAYLDRFAQAAVAEVRPGLARASGRAVTFGWAPRFLHSTGQYHKGGPQVGAFLQITGFNPVDLDVPGKPYTFGELQAAQAAGDRQALAGRDRPLLWLHLTNREDGSAQLLAAVERLEARP